MEFISANPTGPIHVGNGWWGSYGDALARVLDPCRLRGRAASTTSTTPGARSAPSGESLLARRAGTSRCPRAATRASTCRPGRRLRRPRRRDRRPAGGPPSASSSDIRRTLASVGIVFDEWYSQASIEESGAVDETIALLAERGPGLRAGRGHLVPGHRARRHPRPGPAQVQRRRHLPGRRPRLPPRQVPGPGIRPGHRRVRRRPPRPGGQPDGRGGGPRGRPGPARGQAGPDGLAGRQRRGGQDGQAGRQRHLARRRWWPTSAPTPPASSA